MKIGIITCHDVFNYGSSLQAYALSHQLKQNGEQVEILDYRPEYIYRLINFMEVDSPRWQTSLWRRWAYRLRLVPYRLGRLPKYVRYRRFNRNYLPLTARCYRTEQSLFGLKGFDAFICGSDQIWSSVNNRCGEDGAFFLSFAEKEKKIAYAASFGAAEISPVGEACVKKYLPDFNAIGVREASGVRLLGKYEIAARQVVDPVFLPERSIWDQMEKAPKGLPEQYVLTYGYDSSVDLNTLAPELSSHPVISLNSKDFGDYGPREFLYLIKHAQLVVTSSFHAIAFCLIFETPFVAVKTGNAPLFERLGSILELTGLQERIWEEGKKLPATIDFTRARAALAAARNDSLQFLKEALYDSEDL